MDFSATDLLARYGYAAILLGSVVEGETILILAGFAAHQGYLSFPLAALCGALGGLAADQAFFHAGRRYGRRILERFPRLMGPMERVERLMARFQSLLIVMVRFLYGLRTATPLAMGASGVSPWLFLAFNLLGAALWSTLFCGAGYLFGRALTLFFDDIKRYEEGLVLAILAAGAAFLALRAWRRARKARGEGIAPSP